MDESQDSNNLLATYFRRACQIHTDSLIARYLIVNSEGRLDGAEKAERHSELCAFYVAVHKGCLPHDVMRMHFPDYRKVHEKTQELTDFLDEQIGFPIAGTPDYDDLIPKFFERFHDLAMSALAASGRPARIPVGG